jgi:carbamoyltransferase
MDTDKLSTVYLGVPPDYSQLDSAKQQIPSMVVRDTTPGEVAQLLADGNLVALFQGRAEGGPRALGNRSLLCDPRRQDGKDLVNRAKKREWFRPFAASVLEENAKEWFDLAGLDSSPYMMYAVDVLPEVVDKIPAVTHVDGTCRIQTVNLEQNQGYYQLIKEFHSITGVPLVLNTSLNLAGHPLVDSVFDAIVTLYNSEIDYLYLADIGKLVSRQ